MTTQNSLAMVAEFSGLGYDRVVVVVVAFCVCVCVVLFPLCFILLECKAIE